MKTYVVSGAASGIGAATTEVLRTQGDRVITVELPSFVELTVTRTAPGIRGDTATGGTKPATLETGATVQVPLFIEEGQVIRVDRREDKYLTRV